MIYNMERLTNRIKQLDKDDLIVYTKGKKNVQTVHIR